MQPLPSIQVLQILFNRIILPNTDQLTYPTLKFEQKAANTTLLFMITVQKNLWIASLTIPSTLALAKEKDFIHHIKFY